MGSQKKLNKELIFTYKGKSIKWNDVPEAMEEFDKQVDLICGSIAKMLKQKNRSYGNSALDPVRIFSRATPKEQILVRLDDKLSRLKRGDNRFQEDTVVDLLGYLVLLVIAERQERE